MKKNKIKIKFKLPENKISKRILLKNKISKRNFPKKNKIKISPKRRRIITLRVA